MTQRPSNCSQMTDRATANSPTPLFSCSISLQKHYSCHHVDLFAAGWQKVRVLSRWISFHPGGHTALHHGYGQRGLLCYLEAPEPPGPPCVETQGQVMSSNNRRPVRVLSPWKYLSIFSVKAYTPSTLHHSQCCSVNHVVHFQRGRDRHFPQNWKHPTWMVQLGIYPMCKLHEREFSYTNTVLL